MPKPHLSVSLHHIQNADIDFIAYDTFGVLRIEAADHEIKFFINDGAAGLLGFAARLADLVAKSVDELDDPETVEVSA